MRTCVPCCRERVQHAVLSNRRTYRHMHTPTQMQAQRYVQCLARCRQWRAQGRGPVDVMAEMRRAGVLYYEEVGDR